MPSAPPIDSTALVRNRGTGFEEYFADPPLRPEEALHEKTQVYHPRIKLCIHRFLDRRRLDTLMTNYFSQYLFLGGLDGSARPSADGNSAELMEMSPAEFGDLTAMDQAFSHPSDGRLYSHDDRKHWSVDFAAVAAGYLSEVVPSLAIENEHHGHVAISVVESFLRYVLHHDVCPEYGDNVNQALELCGQAREELPIVEACYEQFPGQFNLAAFEQYCAPDSAIFAQRSAGFRRPDDFDPPLVFKAGIALVGEPGDFSSIRNATSVHVVTERERDLEVVEILRPAKETVGYFGRLSAPPSPVRGIVPVGSAIFRPCLIEDGWYRPGQADFAGGPCERLYLDDPILSLMRPGFKFRFMLCELNIGLKFIKSLLGIFPTFYTFLPQLLMKGYKPPVLNDRPPPSVQDPFASEAEATDAVDGVEEEGGDDMEL